MISPVQLAALEAVARSWQGTPFCEGTPVKGAGVSCHHACAEIYFEAGLMPRIPIPNGPSNWRASKHSLIIEWVDASGLFLPVDGGIEPGDFLGFWIGQTVHHAAIKLGGRRIVQSVQGHGVQIPDSIPAVWESRLACVWRLKEFAR